MRHALIGMITGLTAFCAAPLAVSAQTPPDQIRDLPGLTYLGVVGGLEAWTVDGSGALWMRAPDGRALIRGEMFSAAGQDLGAALLGREAAPLLAPVTGPDWSSPTPELLEGAIRISATEALSVLIGEPDAPEVWAWMDPASAATPATYMMLRDRIGSGSVALRVIPVVTTDPGSADLMRLLLAQPDPEAALRAHITGAPTPGVPEGVESLPEELVSGIERNGAIAGRLSPPALPLLLWRAETGPTGLLGVPGADLFDKVVRSGPDAETGAARPDPG